MGRPREVARGGAGYPARLESLAQPPAHVYLEGPWDETAPWVTIVGCRDASGDGMDLAGWLAGELARRGVAVISGLARGIDAAAHRGALDAGGRSGAVLGTPLDRIYPGSHRDLQRRLAASLGLLSEHAPGAPATPGTFASRNRLLAALADAVIVVQGRGESGALITADVARRLGRPLGAVPWDPRETRSAAPHRLIREGAALIRGPEDVIALIPPERRAALQGASPRFDDAWPGCEPSRKSLPPFESRLLAALRHRAEPLDAAVTRSGLTASQAGAAFVALELRALAVREPGGLVRRARVSRAPAHSAPVHSAPARER